MRGVALMMAAALLATGCRRSEVDETGPNTSAIENAEAVSRPPAAMANTVVVPEPVPVGDAWLGDWRGVEGLMLHIARDPQGRTGHYLLTMQYSLDDKGSFDGVATGDALTFTRPDGPQVLRAGDGDATGLKWLAGKKDCLVVKPGEGYCRD